jgi:hypothetical protein
VQICSAERSRGLPRRAIRFDVAAIWRAQYCIGSDIDRVGDRYKWSQIRDFNAIVRALSLLRQTQEIMALPVLSLLTVWHCLFFGESCFLQQLQELCQCFSPYRTGSARWMSNGLKRHPNLGIFGILGLPNTQCYKSANIPRIRYSRRIESRSRAGSNKSKYPILTAADGFPLCNHSFSNIGLQNLMTLFHPSFRYPRRVRANIERCVWFMDG